MTRNKRPGSARPTVSSNFEVALAFTQRDRFVDAVQLSLSMVQVFCFLVSFAMSLALHDLEAHQRRPSPR